jgi:UDP-GlcNAc:undecaprenyl-phosphate GlcNAc-1-phosphate transferase
MLARTHIAAFTLSLLIAAILTPLVRSLAYRFNLLDVPDARKIHQRPIPRLGGIAIALAFLAPLVGLLIHLNRPGLFLATQHHFLVALFVGGAAILALGVYDDICGANHKLKFAVQISVAIFGYYLGLRFESMLLPGIGRIEFGMFALPITVIWVVAIVNALNLIDGLDGLASGVSFFAVSTLFVCGLMDGDVLVCLITASLAGAIVGFLFYNFNPARIFMGDSGSMFVGYVLATMSLATVSKSNTIVALAVPVLALGLPIIDTTLALTRRAYTKRPLFSADRGHVHHRLLDLGLSHRQAVFFLYGVCAFLAITALVVRATRDFVAGGTLFIAGTLIYAMIHLLRFRDVLVERQGQSVNILEQRIFHEARDGVRVLVREMRKAPNLNGAWQSLKDASVLLGVTRVELELHVRPNASEALKQRLRYLAPQTEIESRGQALTIEVMDDTFIYGELKFVYPRVPSVDDQRRALMYVLAEGLCEHLEASYGEQADQLFVVRRHKVAQSDGFDEGA